MRLDRLHARPLLLTTITAGWSLLFWYVFIVEIAYGIYDVPLGLGGAVYPVFFLPVVALATPLYAAVLRRLPDAPPAVVSLGIPILAATIGLLLFCPTDSSDGSFLALLWARL